MPTDVLRITIHDERFPLEAIIQGNRNDKLALAPWGGRSANILRDIDVPHWRIKRENVD